MLNPLVMRSAVEGIADGGLVRMKAVRPDLRNADHALAQVLHEVIRVRAVPLAGAIGDDRLGGPANAMNVYWSPFSVS